jgi:hypothetical protein
MELLKQDIVRFLILDAGRHDRAVRNVLRIYIPEVGDRIEKCRRQTLDLWMLLYLNVEKLIQEATMVLQKLMDLGEDVRDELSESLPWDDGWVGCP